MGYEKALQQYIEATNTHDFNQVKKLIGFQTKRVILLQKFNITLKTLGI